MRIYSQDQSANGTFWASPITGISSSGSLVLGSLASGFMIAPGIKLAPSKLQGYWSALQAAPDAKTYTLTYTLPVWDGLLPPTTNASAPYAAVISMHLSVSSIDNYLQSIPGTPNSVLALVDVASGNMLGASRANLSVIFPTIYPAIGNPNGLLSGAAAELAARFSTPLNGTYDISRITDRTPQSFTFAYNGDSAYCSTAWITNTDTGLSILLILAVPVSDVLGEMAVTLRETIIFVVLFVAFSLVLGVLASWTMTIPIRRATNFDFSSLNNGLLEHHSVFTEIFHLEDSFSLMLNKFSSAIERNKELVAKSSQGGSYTVQLD
ncbi:hypothetical protein HK405_003905 [Cladochytrium tenue]|nr:hypothetical protein HK405_003905 [Cladochytrium tenue]